MVPRNIHTPPWRVIGNSGGRYEAKLEFPEEGVFKLKEKPSMGGGGGGGGSSLLKIFGVSCHSKQFNFMVHFPAGQRRPLFWRRWLIGPAAYWF